MRLKTVTEIAREDREVYLKFWQISYFINTLFVTGVI